MGDFQELCPSASHWRSRNLFRGRTEFANWGGVNRQRSARLKTGRWFGAGKGIGQSVTTRMTLDVYGVTMSVVASYGKVVGGHFVNATIDTNRKGELALHEAGVIFNRAPRLTADTVASWEELISETRGGAADAVSKVGQAVARAALPGRIGKATSAAVDSAASLVRAPHTVRVDWVDGKQSLLELPDKLFQHLAIVLKDCRIATTVPAPEPPAPEPPPPPSVVETLAKEASQLIRSRSESPRQPAEAAPAAQPDVTEQIAKLAALRDHGALTEDEFAAKKAELLGRI